MSKRETLTKDKKAGRPTDRRYKWERRGAAIKHILGVTGIDDFLKKVEPAREHIRRMKPPPRNSADPNRPLKTAVEIVCKSEKSVTAAAGKNPKAYSFGSTGRFARVQSKRPFSQATLRFKLDKKDHAHLDLETIRMARWDEAGKRFYLVPQSGYNQKLGYVYGSITQAGIYTAVGSARDPRIRTTLKLMKTMQRWGGMNPGLGFNDRLCQVILCNPQMQRAVDTFKKNGSGPLANSGYAPEDFGGGYGGGNVCDMCLDSIDPVEIDLDDIEPFEPDFEWVPGGSRRPYFRKWESIGPDNVPGRITSLVMHPGDSQVLYAGSADGGVFKTTDGGQNWYAQWSQELCLAIGGLAIAPSNNEIVYASTGEWGVADAGIFTIPGFSVYRTLNGGSSWEPAGLIQSPYTNAVAIDPTDPNRVYVAGSNSVHRTRNGGATWDVSGVGPSGAANIRGVFDGTISEIIIDPRNPQWVWAGVHTQGVWLSKNGGDTWDPIMSLLGQQAISPRIAFGRGGAHGTSFMAVKMGTLVFTSIDGGANFSPKTSVAESWGDFYYPYCSLIAVDPTNEDILITGSVWAVRSVNGGNTWKDFGGNYHTDLHAIVFHPTAQNRFYLATDSGVWESLPWGGGTDRSSGTARSSGLNTTQCYSVGVSQDESLACAITTQDNTAYRWNGNGTSFNFFAEISGEGGWADYDPQDSGTVYVDNWWSPGTLHRSDAGGDAPWHDLKIETENHLEHFYNQGLAIACNNSQLVLAIRRDTPTVPGTIPVARSTNRGTTWQTPDPLGVANVVITAVKFAPSDDNHAYAASQDGRVWHSTNAGQTWVELDTTGLPDAWIHDIGVDWRNPLRIYLGFGVFGVRQLWRGDVFGSNQVTWFDAGGTAPETSMPPLPVTRIALHPALEDTLYVSNMLGVVRSTDGGTSWATFDDGLPNCMVTSLKVRKRDRCLYASTFGRGVYRRFL